jgi:hypothetical protein
MNFLNSYKFGNDLTEILIEGTNPYADQLLTVADVDSFRNELAMGEKLAAYVAGRVVGSGRGVWVLSDTSVLLRGHGVSTATTRIRLTDITRAECEKGKYGHTLRLEAAGRKFSLYGTSHTLAVSFFRILAKQVPTLGLELPGPLSPEQALRAVHCFKDASLRAQPMTEGATLAGEALLQLVKESSELGMILPSEQADIHAHVWAAPRAVVA